LIRSIAILIAIPATMLVNTPAYAVAPESPKNVWIDTDPACGVSARSDVDDCYALLYALNSPELRIVALSSVFGNADLDTTTSVLHALLARHRAAQPGDSPLIPAHPGASHARPVAGPLPTRASEALATALRARRLILIALGPVTNIAALITLHPELIDRIDAIVAVAGTRPGQRRLRVGDARLLHFHDLNFNLDPLSLETILNTDIPLVLLPFEASERTRITSADLRRLAAGNEITRWLATVSRGWLAFWQNSLGASGFRPFDSLAVAWAVSPGHFECLEEYARIRKRRSILRVRDSLEVARHFVEGRRVRYCTNPDPRLKRRLLGRLARIGPRVEVEPIHAVDGAAMASGAAAERPALTTVEVEEASSVPASRRQSR